MRTIRRTVPVVLACALLVGPLAAVAATAAHTHTRTITKTQAVTPSTRVQVHNLVGHVDVTQGGKELVIRATVVAGGDNDAAARKLADTIDVSVQRENGRVDVRVDYPLATHDAYRYIPTHGDDKHHGVSFLGMHFGGESRSTFNYQGHRVTVYRGGDSGVPLHVDLAVKVPRGTHATIDNRVGVLTASHLDNTLTLTSGPGDIHADNISGSLRMHSTAGDLELRDLDGAARLRTDSGDISARDVHGKMMRAHTGSGDIELEVVRGSLDLHTGSGDIALRGVGPVPHLKAKTGNGDILVKGDLSGVRNFDLSSGNGDIRMATGQTPPVHLEIETGLGDIDVDWRGVTHVKRSHHHYSGDVGDASGSGRIQTGRGDVTLTE